MDYSHIRTLKDYVEAVSILQQDSRSDDYSEKSSKLSEWASKAIFRASKLQLTSAGHREYKVNFQDLAERMRKPDRYIPAILIEAIDGYHAEAVVNIPAVNHLEDEVAA